VRLNAAGKMQWIEQCESGERVHATEPGTTWWKRLGVKLMALLPIEWLL
jgi:putative cardiolipin synthase